MFRSQLLKHTSRAVRASPRLNALHVRPSIASRRAIHNTAIVRQDEKKDDHEGSFARTDPTVEVEHLSESEMPPSAPVQGRGGLHFKRTLASFSLDGRVGVVTGGARGTPIEDKTRVYFCLTASRSWSCHEPSIGY